MFFIKVAGLLFDLLKNNFTTININIETPNIIPIHIITLPVEILVVLNSIPIYYNGITKKYLYEIKWNKRWNLWYK